VKQSGKREAGDILREIITDNPTLSAFLDCYTAFAMTEGIMPDCSTAFAMTKRIVPDRTTLFAMTKGIVPSNVLIIYAISVIANEVKQSGKREAGDILREIITDNTNLSAFLDCFTSFAMTNRAKISI
jgi:hypothetical protein